MSKMSPRDANVVLWVWSNDGLFSFPREEEGSTSGRREVSPLDVMTVLINATSGGSCSGWSHKLSSGPSLSDNCS
jgi:hypothetical protein